jgi:outer membrane protein assembly factor BamB
VRTTISCRLFAQLRAPSIALLIMYAATLAAGQQPQPFPAPAATRPARGVKPVQTVPGVERWSTAIGAAAPAIPPLMTDRHAFVLVPPASVAAFGVQDGVELWRVALTPDQPLVGSDERLYVSAGEALHALDAATGALAWRQPTGPLTAPPLVHEGWIVTVAAAEVVARRAADGTVVWRQPNGAQQFRPTIEGDTLYLPLAEPKVVALDLTTGARKWERTFGGAPSEIAALAGRLYVASADKYFYCLDADDGRIEWRHRVGAALIGRPAADAERVYFAAMDNVIRAVDRVDGALKWQAGLPFRPSAGPLLFGTAVVAPGAAAALQTFDAATGKAGRAITFAAPLSSPLSIRESDKGPLALTLTGAVDVEYKLSLWEPSMVIPTGPLTALPGKAVPLPTAQQLPPGAP